MSARQLYAGALGKLPQVGADEQLEIARRYATGHDPRDAERLVLANLRLVVKLACELGKRSPIELMDLVQEGNAGLIHAVDKFDPSRGVKFSSYAGLWIRAFILRHLMETCRIVRISSTREGRKRFFARTLPAPDLSLDGPGSHEEDGGYVDGRSPIESLAAEDGWRPDVRAEELEAADRVRGTLARAHLGRRERAILEQRLLAETPTPLKELARTLDVTGERTRQLEKRLVARLRQLAHEPPRAAAA